MIILGAEGDSLKDERPDWGLDGSFLVFRKLHQNVPQFQKFIQDNPVIGTNGIPVEGGSALRCAQFFGRWESGEYGSSVCVPILTGSTGAPIVKHPTSDPGAKIGADSKTNNDFIFQSGNQELCPYSAHIRKTNPRDPTGMPPHHLEHTSIVRAGIPYGPGEIVDLHYTGFQFYIQL